MWFKERPSGEAVRVRLVRVHAGYRVRELELLPKLRPPRPVAAPRVGALGTWYYTMNADRLPMHWFAATNLLQRYIEGPVDAEKDLEGVGLLGLQANRHLPEELEVYIPDDRSTAFLGVLSNEAVVYAAGTPPTYERAEFDAALDWTVH